MPDQTVFILFVIAFFLQCFFLIIIWLKVSKTTADSSQANQLNQILELKVLLERIEKAIRDENHVNRKEQSQQFEIFARRIEELTNKNESRLERIRLEIQSRLENIQKDNSLQLDKMRQTVDEKLTETLDKRLGEKFMLVNDRLEQVYKGLGEMQTLASGVGDLKKVLTNVKTRGTWGEVQLGNILSQVMANGQYQKNVTTKKGSADRVEFAIKIPSKTNDDDHIWLPIDAKFPIEDYRRLITAQEAADVPAMLEAAKALELRIKAEAKDISTKYIDPPHTTDFALLYLPIEGLYAEITQNTELCEKLQRDFRVIVVGPNTILAIMNSLQMGFRTLAIEKRSAEVWSILAKVKVEFGVFGDLLEKTSKKLQEAGNTIDSAAVKSRNLQKKLARVEELPGHESLPLIAPIN